MAQLFLKNAYEFENPSRRVFLAGGELFGDSGAEAKKTERWVNGKESSPQARELAIKVEAQEQEIRKGTNKELLKLYLDLFQVGGAIGNKEAFNAAPFTVDAKYSEKGLLQTLEEQPGASDLRAAFAATPDLRLLAYATIFKNFEKQGLDANYLPMGAQVSLNEGEVTVTYKEKDATGKDGIKTAKSELFPWSTAKEAQHKLTEIERAEAVATADQLKADGKDSFDIDGDGTPDVPATNPATTPTQNGSPTNNTQPTVADLDPDEPINPTQPEVADANPEAAANKALTEAFQREMERLSNAQDAKERESSMEPEAFKNRVDAKVDGFARRHNMTEPPDVARPGLVTVDNTATYHATFIKPDGSPVDVDVRVEIANSNKEALMKALEKALDEELARLNRQLDREERKADRNAPSSTPEVQQTPAEIKLANERDKIQADIASLGADHPELNITVEQHKNHDLYIHIQHKNNPAENVFVLVSPTQGSYYEGSRVSILQTVTKGVSSPDTTAGMSGRSGMQNSINDTPAKNHDGDPVEATMEAVGLLTPDSVASSEYPNVGSNEWVSTVLSYAKNETLPTATQVKYLNELTDRLSDRLQADVDLLKNDNVALIDERAARAEIADIRILNKTLTRWTERLSSNPAVLAVDLVATKLHLSEMQRLLDSTGKNPDNSASPQENNNEEARAQEKEKKTLTKEWKDLTTDVHEAVTKNGLLLTYQPFNEGNPTQDMTVRDSQDNPVAYVHVSTPMDGSFYAADGTLRTEMTLILPNSAGNYPLTIATGETPADAIIGQLRTLNLLPVQTTEEKAQKGPSEASPLAQEWRALGVDLRQAARKNGLSLSFGKFDESEPIHTMILMRQDLKVANVNVSAHTDGAPGAEISLLVPGHDPYLLTLDAGETPTDAIMKKLAEWTIISGQPGGGAAGNGVGASPEDIGGNGYRRSTNENGEPGEPPDDLDFSDDPTKSNSLTFDEEDDTTPGTSSKETAEEASKALTATDIDNHFTGRGSWEWEDTAGNPMTYKGGWLNGKPYGQGIITDSAGKVTQVEFNASGATSAERDKPTYNWIEEQKMIIEL